MRIGTIVEWQGTEGKVLGTSLPSKKRPHLPIKVLIDRGSQGLIWVPKDQVKILREPQDKEDKS